MPVTIDHQVIFSWAQRRGAHPSTLEGDERPWPLFFNFDWSVSELKEVSWDRFFVEFERANLAFVYQDVAADGTRHFSRVRQTPRGNWIASLRQSNGRLAACPVPVFQQIRQLFRPRCPSSQEKRLALQPVSNDASAPLAVQWPRVSARSK